MRKYNLAHQAFLVSLHECMPKGTTALHLIGKCRPLVGCDNRQGYRILGRLVRDRLVRRHRNGMSLKKKVEKMMRLTANDLTRSLEIPPEPYRLTERGIGQVRSIERQWFKLGARKMAMLMRAEKHPAIIVSRKEYELLINEQEQMPDIQALRDAFARLAEEERAGRVRTRISRKAQVQERQRG
jgi:hypothetical protein